MKNTNISFWQEYLRRMTEMANIGRCTKRHILIKFQLLKWCEIMYNDEVRSIEWFSLFSN